MASREWGQGTPLVLLHGGHGSWMHWVRNIGKLSRHFRVIAPDLPGFGDSDDFALDPHDPGRLEHLLTCLRLGVEQLVPAGPLHLAGFSFGGATAGMLAPRLPNLQRLALMGCGGHGGPRRDKEPLLNWRTVSGAARQAAYRQNLQAFMLSDPAAANALALQVHAWSCERTRFRSKGVSRGTMLLDALKDFDKPVFMAWGEDDVTAVPEEAAKTLTQGKASRDWTIIARAGHWVQFEKADEINTLLISWFNAS
ncbi:MAG: alpha/beta hydrolase [Variovorax sp.]|nr:alpha/beta hydrolase [Variovorax sp.]